MSYYRMKLTITEVKDRVKLIMAFRKWHFTLTLKEATKLVDNLPYIDDTCYTDKNFIYNTFDDCCVYTYEQMPDNTSYLIKAREPYILAKAWFDKLPQEDQDKINVLISACYPHMIG